MNPQNKKKKKLFGFLDRSHSNPHLPESGPSEIETSSLPPSQHESRKGLPVPKFLRKVIKRRPASSAQKSPHPEPAAVGSSVQPVPPSQTTQDPSPPIAPAPEAAPDQASNLAIPKPEPPSDLKPVETALADAEAGFKDIARGSKSVQDAASVPNNLPSDPNTIDSLSAILGPLKAFNSIATELAALHPYATLALGIFTYASKVDKNV
ncbi:uncharacterized protein EDB91DRAFT_1086244 [Suillus paluster]|uniref:uncharacterized protein n=1 Tax=Suillus paluster TaxID=48578 RepID=UPI001B87F870|nr:uncharacterized protein EDB91DRAFT_1086244 [Suillus paluster]KAG1727938.1 hypothetical protein EDB91DRAFT_1086244 [Suillus paluster]